ncbi:MAG: amidohydrolase family protein [Phycisphaerales bacterium]|nr:amidohydrolase family protein [Phycisphaerales bacterium]
MHLVAFQVLALSMATVAAPVNDPGPRPNGPFEPTHRCDALTGATVVTEPGTQLENATIVIRNGIIDAVGTDVDIPADARLWPMDDRVIYPGFIEPAATIETSTNAGPSAHWNTRIRPETDLRRSGETLSDKEREALRAGGFCVAAVYPEKGILRGTGSITTTAEASEHLIDCGGRPAMAASFERGGWGEGGGPGSLMGAIALLRQTLSDARWYQEAKQSAERNQLEPPSRHDDLEALNEVVSGNQRMMFAVGDVKEAMRAKALANEMNLDLMILGNGDEYRDLDGAKSLNWIIVPVAFPDRPKLASIDAAIRVPLRTLQIWEQSPTNLRRLNDAGVQTCVTTKDLGSPKEIRKALIDATHAGLERSEALAQITTHPARMLGISDTTGRIAVGNAAHLVICDGDYFEDDTKIEETWVSGHRSDHDVEPLLDRTGSGTLSIGEITVDATLDTGKKKLSLTLDDGTKAKVKKVDISGHRVTAAIDGRVIDHEGWIRLAGVVRDDALIGRGVLSDGSTLPMRLTLTGNIEEKEESDTEQEIEEDSETSEDPVAGTWSGSIAFGEQFEAPLKLVVEKDGDKISGTMWMMEREMGLAGGTWNESTSTLEFLSDGPGGGQLQIVAVIDGNEATGTANSRRGEANFSVSREGSQAGEEGDDSDNAADIRWSGIPKDIAFPLGARGRLDQPAAENVRFEHATIWTADQTGIIEDGCLIIRDGRISYVGSMGTAPAGSERVVDATGMHITPGLIDCHSHTGIDGGVNEFNEACTAEVGIGDVISGDDMNWYRQLAGGLTAANQLHGSANPIGGRNSVVKLRWGRPARDYPMSGAPTGIKFALGENVKRSSGRYPDTRMGVESFIRDRLAAARHYDETWTRWDAMTEEERTGQIPPRMDYELQTLREILAGERLIHCHSYRQDEILALLRTCEEFDITIGTLQHILEGYKVADDIARHGAGASSFSDWWAYKVEVMDAIPWNGAIMHDQGVLVSFNSDDSELATRMNDEAAKAVRYGGLSPNEALKFVTLNPAKQLGIDAQTGSLVAGKDADFVLWNRDPLDSYSLCMQTWIDGARYYDREEDLTLAERDATERTRLVKLVLHESLGEPPSPTSPEDEAGGDNDTQPAWAANPYLEPADDHRGCCGIPVNHLHTEECQ